MSKEPHPILSQIERYIAAKGMSASAFGKEALGDPNFVFDLRNPEKPREVRRDTEAKVLQFIWSEGKVRAA